MERIFFALFHVCTPLALTLTRRHRSGRGQKGIWEGRLDKEAHQMLVEFERRPQGSAQSSFTWGAWQQTLPSPPALTPFAP